MRLSFYQLCLLFILGSLFPVYQAQATHLRAGEIIVRRLNCTSLTFEITINAYTNTGSPVRFSDHGSGILSFGDGTFMNPPQQENTSSPGLGTNVGYVKFVTTHSYSGASEYKISYMEANRNEGILNIGGSINTPFYIETIINIDPFLGCDNSPVLLVPPIDKACTGAAWYHNPGAYDPDGDSLSYEMTTPRQGADRNVNNYRDPNVREFYDRIGIDYGTANETHSGTPSFTINSITGTITWDAPGTPGEYNIAFFIKQWRKIAGEWVLMGSVTRDMQIVVEDCNNKRPQLDPIADICVEAGTTIHQSIFGFDPDGDNVKIEAFSEIFNLSVSPATWQTNPAIYQPSGPNTKASIQFVWNTKCEHVKEQYYQVVFKITDKPAQGASLVDFKTWRIRIVAPAPKWQTATLDASTRSANLAWNTYVCQSAEKMQVWRRVDSFAYTPPECITGIPESLGYRMIAELPITQTTYKDTNNGKGLAAGARYCYRLLAVFRMPGGGESYVSQEICIPPILADAPVITHVTVDKTDVTAGQITVRWRSPFDSNAAQFPPPYSYEVYRAHDFTGTSAITIAHTGKLSDTVFVDTGINTQDVVYNYRIVCYDKNNVKVDTSSVASSVRLEIKSQKQKIELDWSFDVPWSNRTQDYPTHLIYRGPPGTSESQMELIGSVDVNTSAFTYTDSGQYQSRPLLETETYCYRVMTRGAYGNPSIEEPLNNFSQIICAQPVDDAPPACRPVITAKGLNCDEFIQTASCHPSNFSNLLTWNRPAQAACGADIRSYKIYYYADAGSNDTTTVLAENVRDTFYIDSNLPSYARCYRVAAVDRSGNESPLSEEFCFDNCPHYELPNVFTPNGDHCNELFSAFSDRELMDESGNGACGPIDLAAQRRQCARFVQKVHFTVVNRWGMEVFDYQSGNEKTIYIDWDGRDNEGKELSTGVYYYQAEVTYDVVDPSQRTRTMKGWVHLIR